MRLTPEQMEQFRTEGWLLLPELFTPEEVDVLRREAVAIYDQHRPQGCSTLFTESHGKDGFEAAECCGVAVLGDRLGLVDPQDIVGEAAHSGEDAGIFSDARRVFT